MWTEFTKASEGVVIKSVIGRLKRCFDSTSGDQCVERVEYRDIEAGGEPMPIEFPDDVLTKDKKWSYQNEVRIFMMDPGARGCFEAIDEGVYVPVLLKILVQQIYVPPNAPRSLIDAVREGIERAGLDDVRVERSSLENAVQHVER